MKFGTILMWRGRGRLMMFLVKGERGLDAFLRMTSECIVQVKCSEDMPG